MEVIVGAGEVKPAPLIESIHDDTYDVDVYPARCSHKPLIDLLVPAYGKVELTIKCFEALYQHTQAPFHLIFLSADRPDEETPITHLWALDQLQKHDNITYCHRKRDWNTGNQFFNCGLKYALTEYVATIMNSVQVEPAWEVCALDLMKSDDKIGTIGFKCLFPNGLIESAGIRFAGIVPSDIGRDEPGYRCNEIRDAEAVQWAFALHRKKALEGTLEEDVFNGHVGWDDIDNNLCVRKKGWKIVYCGQGVGIHAPRSTRGSNSVDAFLKNQENAHRFFKRWGLWEQYLEGNKMNVADVMKGETKDALTQAIQKIQVLRDLLTQQEKAIQPLVNKALKELGVEPGQYLLEMNPQTNTWQLKPNVKPSPTPEAVVPTPEAAVPASDTENSNALKETVKI